MNLKKSRFFKNNPNGNNMMNSHLIEPSLLTTLKSNGRSKHPEDINVLELFLDRYKSHPKLYRLTSDDFGNYYNYDLLKEKIRSKYPDARLLFSDTFYDIDKNIEYNKQETWHLRNGLMLQLEGGETSDFYIIEYETKNVPRICSYNLFLVNGELEELEDIKTIFKECQLEKIESISIGMVSIDEGGFYIKDFDLKQKSFELVYLDEHYGDGFTDFDQKLIKRLVEETKGLTLFHGVPGSGKTTYIRHLLRKLKELNRDNNVLYFPPTMVGSITDPGFINFISEWVSENTKGKNYLLIEDAEPLLESRDMSRNIGITNLLNLTDGLLNDILNIQIIATFNTKISNIDDALLRPERLMARKEFSKLSIDKAKDLASKVGINPELVDKEMTLADLYSLKNERKPIIHNIDENEYDGKIRGFSSRKK